MSRHSFTTGPTRWTVGWDPELASYYAQVEPSVLPAPVAWWDPADPGYDDPLEDVVGTRPGELPTVIALVRVLTGQVRIPTAVRKQLAADKRPLPARG